MRNNIQVKIMLLVSCIVVVFLTGLIFLRYTEQKKLLIMMKNDEKNQAVLIDNSIKLLGKNLEALANDYSLWDGMVSFVKKPTKEWSSINIDPGLTIFNTHIILIYSADFSPIYFKSIFKDSAPEEFPIANLQFRNFIARKLFTHFFLQTSDGLMEFYGAPIQPSADISRSSKPAGYLFAGRLWTDNYLKQLGTIVSAAVTISSEVNSAVIKKNHAEDFCTVNSHRLYSWDEKPASLITVVREMPIYKSTDNLSTIQFYAIGGFEALSALCISIYLFIIVNNPLRVISKSLKTGNIDFLKKIKKKRDEFGRFASLIIQFFNQKQELEEEILAKKKVQEELLRIQGNLEFLVERRTSELEKAKEKAEQSDKLKSEFLAQISHEIRSPISTMLNHVSLIKDEIHKPYDDDVAFSFNAINSSSKRLIRTIDLILNMSQIQNGNIECEFSDLNIQNDVLINIVNEFSSLASLRGLNLSLCCDTENLIVHADHYSVNQIFTNLVDNAIKYTERGDIQIRIYNNPSNNTCVDIIDTGIGISEAFQKNLFLPFTQEQQGYTRKYDGNGLGLALVKKYCELNNALIKVKSLKGVGSTFTVEFLKKAAS